MPVSQFVGDLGDIQGKLVRSLAGAGSLGVDLLGGITPTIKVADATVPGNVQFRGKRFAYGESVAAGVGFKSRLVVQNQVAVTYDRIYLGAAAASVCRIAVVASTVTKPYVPVLTVTRWSEQRQVSADLAPLLTLPFLADAGTPGDTLWTGYVPAASTLLVPILIHCPANSQLSISCELVNTVFVGSFEGYIY